MKLWRQDKGHRAEMKTFIEALQRGESSPIDFEEIIEVTETSFRISYG